MAEPQAELAPQRESPLHPGVKLERRLPPFYATFFYAFPAAVSWIWLYFQRPGLSTDAAALHAQLQSWTLKSAMREV